MKALLYIIPILALAAFIVYRRFFYKPAPKPMILNGVTIPVRFPHAATSSGGVIVCSVVEIPAFVLQLIENGISTQIEKSSAAHPNWTANRRLLDYQVFLIEPMAIAQVNTPGAPELIVGGITCSGTNFGFNDGVNPSFIVLPHQANQEWQFTDYLENSARYESEHIALRDNDYGLFQYYTGPNDVHPIFP